MDIVIRRTRDTDARAFIEVHHAAIRGLAAGHYPPEVIADWAPEPITEEVVRQALDEAGGELRFVAEVDGGIVGMAVFVPKSHELRACYVLPEAAGRGVGKALVREIERVARELGIPALELDASLNAVPFYSVQGYVELRRDRHTLRTGRVMSCARMRKTL